VNSPRPILHLSIWTLCLSLTGCGLFGGGASREAPPGEAPGAAGAGAGGSSDVWSRSAYRGSGDPLGADGFENALRGQISIPPDRALVHVQAEAKGGDRLAASSGAMLLGQALATEIGDEGMCQARVVDRGAVRFNGRQDWRGRISLRVDALLTGLPSVDARAERIEHCLARIDAAANGREEGAVRMGAPLLTLDQLETHRGELLARAFSDLTAVAGTTDTPTQFDANATHCTSGGHVNIVERSLDGIVLGVDMTCRPDFAAPVPPARAGRSEGDLED